MKKHLIFILLLTALSLWGEAEWLIMLYLDADDYQLEQDILYDYNEAENAGSSSRVTIVSQLDRYDGGYEGDGNWHETRRYLLQKDSNMETIKSRMVKNLGETNMADGATLEDFIVWGITHYPAKKYALILSDHGSGWPGGWSDPNPDDGDILWMAEMAGAMGKALGRVKVDKLDFIGFDACLMGHIEVFSTIAPYTRYAAASQETEPGLGWAYNGFLEKLLANPGVDGGGLGRFIVQSYLKEDLTVAEWERSKKNRSGDEDYLSFLTGDTTLSAVNLQRMDLLEKALNNLVSVLQDEDQTLVAKARAYAQSFTNIFDEAEPSPYIDLGHFAKLLKQDTTHPSVKKALEELLKAIEETLVAETHGTLRPGSTGLSIHFPNSTIYTADWGGPESYAYSVPRFVTNTLWDEFLLFHYTGTAFPRVGENLNFGPPAAEPTPQPPTPGPLAGPTPPPVTPSPALPSQESPVTAPGSGKIRITGMKTDKTKVAQDDTLTLTAEIHGANIAYIYIFAGYYDEESDSVLIADKDFIEADDSRVIDGVHYPNWQTGENKIHMEFEWEPLIFTLDDGEDSFFALLEPTDYGATADDAVYMVEGMYKTGKEKEERYTQAYFNGKGSLMKMYAFKPGQGMGAPREVTPRAGDTFTILETWIELDEKKEGTFSQERGGTLRVGKTPIEWFDDYAFTGPYVLGFIVEDFNGNQYNQFVDVEVIP